MVFPIFCNFANEFNKNNMKYNKVNFHINADEPLLQDARDVLAAMLGDCGFETFEETEQGITGYIQQQLFQKELVDECVNDFPFPDITIIYNVEEAEYKDWNEQWENEGFQPITIGECTIHDGRHLPENPTEIMVEIDAKMAFGTGNHETTQMIVQQLMQLDLQGKRMIDCGCGTGILGIIAMKRGASEVLAYDIDEWSTDNATHNAVINGILTGYATLLGDSSVLKDIEPEKKYDLIVANINRNILLADMPIWKSLLATDGILLLSGFYATDVPILNEKAKELGLRHSETITNGEWACLTFSHQ